MRKYSNGRLVGTFTAANASFADGNHTAWVVSLTTCGVSQPSLTRSYALKSGGGTGQLYDMSVRELIVP